jgi:hypothetical protein
MPLAFVLTPGQTVDYNQFPTVLGKIRVPGPVGRPRTRPGAVAADRASYRSKMTAQHLTWDNASMHRYDIISSCVRANALPDLHADLRVAGPAVALFGGQGR